MKIFITGVTGFIGAHLTLELAKRGNTIHAIYRSENKIKGIVHENLKWFKGDILDVKSLEKAMFECEQVYHVAAFAAVWENNPGDFIKFNVQGTINVIETAQKLGIKHIVVTSTAGVFGPSLNGIITENTVSSIPLFTGYERSKAESERIIADYVQKGMNIKVVNPTRVYGPGALNESNSVTIMVKKYLEGKWHFIPGDGKSIGNYVFVDDVVSGHILAMQNGKAGERYILAGENVSYNQFFDILNELSGKKFWLVKIPLIVMLAMANSLIYWNKLTKIAPKITPAHIRKFNYSWEVSNLKAQTELGYKNILLKEGLKQTIHWILSKKD